MRKLFQLAAVVAIGISGTLAMSAPSFAQTLNVTIAAGHPPVFRWVKHLSETFIPTVNAELEGTGYEIVWSEQYGGSLAKVGGVLEAVEEGLAEIGIVSSLFEPSKLSLQNVSYFTPFVNSNSTAVSNMIDELHKTSPQLRASWESNGLEYLGGAIGIDDYLLMTKFPVNSIADLDGQKIGAPGPAVNWLKGTGAVGVSGNLTTYFNELKTGVYDGVIVFASAALPGKLYEVAPFITKVGFGAQYAGGIAANKDWFDSQPEIVQNALRTAAEADRIAYLQDLDASVTSFLSIMETNGATISEVSDQMRADWVAGMDNVAKIWAEELDAAGQPGTEVLKIYMDAMRASGAVPLRDWDLE